MKQVFGFFDGACDNKKGIGGYGYVIACDNDGVVKVVSEQHGAVPTKKVTNNVAEYFALLKLMKEIKEGDYEGCVTIFGDSQLVICQVNGEYEVKNDRLKKLYKKACEMERDICRKNPIEFKHIYRENNTRADELSKMGLLEARGA